MIEDICPEKLTVGAQRLLMICGNLKAGERCLIVYDQKTQPVVDILLQTAKKVGSILKVIEITDLEMHGSEPPSSVADQMCESQLVIGLTRKSMAHTKARQRACLAGARYLSLPEYSLELLQDKSLLADFIGESERTRRVAEHLSNKGVIRIITEKGTDLTMSSLGRQGNCCPGYVSEPGTMGSPPDIEANVSPIETSANGIAIIDGSIPHPELGLLDEDIRLEIKDGKISRIHGSNRVLFVLEKLFNSVDGHKSRILAECGIGLNPFANLTGVMLTDEGALGTMHLGFGSNSTVGGLNNVSFHLDFVLRLPTISVDGVVIVDKGKVLL
jgi:2,5-dihydroxypyridine 5,6-dioxygenase